MSRCRACKRETHALTKNRQLCWDCDTLRRLINKVPGIAAVMLREHGYRQNPGVKGRGRRPATGRFKTRKDLVDRVMFLWTTTDMSQEEIAEDVTVHRHTVRRILQKVKEEEERGDRKEWDWRY